MNDSDFSDLPGGIQRKPEAYVIKLLAGAGQLVGTAKHVASGREIPFANAQALVEILEAESMIRKSEENDHEI